MIKGLGREKGLQTAVSMVILLVNIMIVSHALSLLGERDQGGSFRFTAEVIPVDYFLLLLLSLGFGLTSMWLIRYPGTQARWGARLFAALLLPAFLLLFTLNMRIFSWEQFQNLLGSLL